MMGSDGKTTSNFTQIGEAVLSFEFNNADNFSSFIVLSFNIITFTKILNLFDGAITHFDCALTGEAASSAILIVVNLCKILGSLLLRNFLC